VLAVVPEDARLAGREPFEGSNAATVINTWQDSHPPGCARAAPHTKEVAFRAPSCHREVAQLTMFAPAVLVAEVSMPCDAGPRVRLRRDDGEKVGRDAKG
jgi:hypothetical protein